ncbi:MAG TPA: DUF748 domain-containing protein [Candidatus Krumholzibacteria bacterium]|nr:DUF748 domain-containing protein [Candidatus Krumholzibacteria bacterium]
MTNGSNETTPRRRGRRLLRDWRFWIAVVVALYTLVGFVVVPMVAKHEIPVQTRALLKCESSVKSVRFNPYTFNARVRGFEIKDRKGEPLGSVAELFVNFAPWPLTKKQVVLEEVRATGPQVFVRLRQDGSMNLLDLVPVETPAQPAAPAGKEKPTEMVVRVDRASIALGSARFDDETTDPDASVGADSIQVVATGYRSTPGDTTAFQLSYRGMRGSIAKAHGWVMPLEAVVQARVDVDSLQLTQFAPYLKRFAYLDVKSGKVAAHGDMHLVAPPDKDPVIDFTGDIVSDDLKLYDSLKNQDLFGYKRISILKVQAKSVPPAAHVDEIAINGIYARIAIAADRSFNVIDVFAPAIALTDSLDKAAGKTPAHSDAAVSGNATQGNQTVTVTVKSKAASTKEPPPDIAIGRITIDGGEVDFSDLSLPLPFATRVHSVKGEVTAIAADNAAGSSLKIEGTVDEHGFAKATGYINPFDPVAFTDIKVDFRNIELTAMTPYSGKFMGYRIKHGKLSLGLEYDIKQAQLKADNKILLEKLYLGEKVPSPDAVGLPIKLALALLRDKNGNIDLDLAVHGDLNDPKVNTASLIWQALKKVIVKITTAPFRFLGHMLGIGGGDDMEFVEFEGGESRLTPPQHERLDNLGKALVERPQLKLQISGAYDKNIDTAALRKNAFESQVMSRLLASAAGDSAVAKASVADPSSGRMQAVLEAMMTESFGAQSVIALKAERTTVPATGGEARLDLATYFQAMRDKLTAAQKVSDADLEKLSATRATAIQGYMVEMAKIPAERIEIIEPDVNDDKGDWVRCKLALDGSE